MKEVEISKDATGLYRGVSQLSLLEGLALYALRLTLSRVSSRQLFLFQASLLAMGLYANNLCLLPTVSEIEAVNVRLIEDKRRAEPHLVIGDFDLAKPSGIQFFVAPLKRARYQSVGRINR